MAHLAKSVQEAQEGDPSGVAQIFGRVCKGTREEHRNRGNKTLVWAAEKQDRD